MSREAAELRRLVIDRALNGPGAATPARRRAAFDQQIAEGAAGRLADKVARHAWTVTDEDMASALAAGSSEDEIFELVIAAALGQSTRQLERARAALDAAAQALDPAGDER